VGDTRQILETLRILTRGRDEAAFELRAIGAGYNHRKIVSGYFTTATLEAASKAAAELSGKCAGVYLCLNPANPALLARAKNHVKEGPKSTTSDKDIVSRQWILVDLDPVRPTDISSNDSEHDAALARASECRAWLTSQGWPEPVCGDSSNGAHLLYPTNEPNDEATRKLFERVLKALALRFSDGTVQLDQTTYNAARISKLYGTLSRKGDNTQDRPHRLSRIISTPAEILPMPRLVLEQLAATLPASEPRPQKGQQGSKYHFDLEAFIEKHLTNFGVMPPKPWEGGIAWVLETCPFDSGHTNRSAIIGRHATGAIWFKCHHNSCSSNDWTALRGRFEARDERAKVARGGASPAEANRPESKSPSRFDESLRRVGQYGETPRGLVRYEVVNQAGDEEEIPLTNFRARIVANVEDDDGVEKSLRFEIEAHLGERTKNLLVPAAQFPAMDWAIEQLGARAITYAGRSTAEHARTAIQELSTPAWRTIFHHTGWREIEGHGHVYVHGGGGIGAAGAINGIGVELPPQLSPFLLEPGADLSSAIMASLEVLDLAPDRVTVPPFAAISRAILGGADFSVYLWGISGRFKTELATLIQQHFGAGFDSRHPPAHFGSTDNANELFTFIAKDSLLLIDDLRPPKKNVEGDRTFSGAMRLFRAQGNEVGRSRLNPDSTMKPAKPPRGLILATGEELPPGYSVNARLFTVEIKTGDINPTKLAKCQADARAGLYARATYVFTRWLAPQLIKRRTDFRAMVAQLRIGYGYAHPRTADIRAQLTAASSLYIEFLLDTLVIDAEAAANLYNRFDDSLKIVAEAQKGIADQVEPTAVFFQLLSSALIAGHAYITDRTGNPPRGLAAACGWRPQMSANGNQMSLDGGDHWHNWLPPPKADRIGFIDNEDLFLDSKAAFLVAQRMVADGYGIEGTELSLKKQLYEQGFLVTTELDTRKTYEIRRKLDGNRKHVLHLRAAVLGLVADLDDSNPDEAADEQGMARGLSGEMSGAMSDETPPSTLKFHRKMQ
jgi:hypothetical protein